MPRTGHLRVRFYPWWKHPLYVRARERDEPWGFSTDDDAEKEVIVHAKNIRSFLFSNFSTTPRSVTEWRFERHHPLLLRYEPSVSLFCNSAMAPEQALRIIDVVEESVCGWLPPWEFLNALSTAAFIKLVRSSSFLLGRFLRR